MVQLQIFRASARPVLTVHTWRTQPPQSTVNGVLGRIDTTEVTDSWFIHFHHHFHHFQLVVLGAMISLPSYRLLRALQIQNVQAHISTSCRLF